MFIRSILRPQFLPERRFLSGIPHPPSAQMLASCSSPGHLQRRERVAQGPSVLCSGVLRTVSAGAGDDPWSGTAAHHKAVEAPAWACGTNRSCLQHRHSRQGVAPAGSAPSGSPLGRAGILPWLTCQVQLQRARGSRADQSQFGHHHVWSIGI